MIWTRLFWKDTAERVISTTAQTLSGVLLAGGLGIFDVDWVAAISVSLLAGLVAFAKAIGATYVGDPSSASLVPSMAVYPTTDVSDTYDPEDTHTNG